MRKRKRGPGKSRCCGHARYRRAVVNGIAFCRCLTCVTLWLEMPLVAE